MENLKATEFSTGRHANLHTNIINNAKFSGNIRKSAWIYKKALKGFFKTVPKNERKEAFDFTSQLDSMITVLNAVHGKNWDFNLDPIVDYEGDFTGYELYVNILYPNILITNSDGDEHTIEDLIVSFLVKYSGFKDAETRSKIYSFSNLKGTRATLSYVEWINEYLHSHLSSCPMNRYSSAFKFKDFCLGTNTPIHDVMEELHVKYSPEMFEMFLYNIETLVSWESLEGVPYKKIRELVLTTNKEIVDYINSKTYYERLLPTITKQDVNEIDFVIQNNAYKVVLNHKFINMIKRKVIYHLSNYWNKLLVQKRNSILYGYVVENNTSQKDLDRKFINHLNEVPYFYLQDRKVIFKVKKHAVEQPKVENYQIHPNFLEYVKSRFENKLHENTIRKCSIERKYQSVNA